MEISIGTIVKFENGYYRISADCGKGDKRWFNLRSIFHNTIYRKRVPASQVIEAETEFYNRWSQSETYLQM
jgi:hypothetical protein